MEVGQKGQDKDNSLKLKKQIKIFIFDTYILSTLLLQRKKNIYLPSLLGSAVQLSEEHVRVTSTFSRTEDDTFSG